MITLYRPSGYDSPRASSFAGRSVDDKPLDVENGSSFKEIDTGRVFRYDKENNLWIEQKSTSGGTGATEPYIEETYDADGNLIGAKMYGYTKIRDNLFADCTNLAHVSLPEGLTSIGEGAFQNCTNLALTSLPEGLTSIGMNAFSGCTNLALTSLSAGLTSISSYAFYDCTNLALTSLPAGLTRIDDYAFYGCTNLALTSLPEGVTSIGVNAFQNCTSLTSITFKGTPTRIYSIAFSGCTNLTDIKVPWAEGAVSGAPWGAKNATITYNYTE